MPFAVIYGLSIIIGELLFVLIPKRAHITLTNLKLCLPELSHKARNKMAHQHFHLLVCSVLSIGSIWWSNRSRMRRIVKVKGLEHLQNAEISGQNIVILAPHFVALDAGGIALSLDRALTSMYQTNKNPVFDHLAIRQRSRFNIELFDRKAPLTGLIRKIRSGQPFYYLPDQNAGEKHGVFVPFFGIQASTFPTLGKITRAGKAVVIPCTTKIIPWRGIETELYAPLIDFPKGDAIIDTTRMNLEVEHLVRTLGADYLWSHKRFKRRPDGEADLYKS